MNAVSPLATFDGAEAIIEGWCEGLMPDPPTPVDEWSDSNIILPAIGAAEAGDYSTARTPYLREILTNLSPMSPVVTTILMKGAQLGASQAGLNWLGYIIAVAGGPAIVVCPTVAMAELYSKQRLGPMIEACKALRAKIPPNRGKASGNTLLIKTFPGGMIRLTGGNSAAALKSMPAKWRLYEEPDEYPKDLEGQGNAVDLVRVRGRTFGRRAKEFLNCTPNMASDSVIWAMYLKGDQREYRMPCPHNCGHRTVFNRENFRFEKGQPQTAHMVCENPECGGRIDEARHKEAMLDEGVWIPRIANAPAHMPRSYYLPSFYSPVGWQSWADIATETENAEGNYSKTKTLWNTTYGLPWNDVTDTPSYEAIWARRSTTYVSRQIPAEALFLTAGVDVGLDHLEVGVWAYGRKGKRWLVEHVRLRGALRDPEHWARLKAFLQRRYVHPCGAIMPIRRVAVDRGRWPDVVMPWVQKQDPDWIVAIRGNEKIDAQILKESKWRFKSEDGHSWSSDEGVLYWTLGVGLLKLELMGQLNLPRPAPGEETPPGWVDLPMDVELGWCEQLVSEEYVTVKSKTGRPKATWRSIGGLRHEALDCANYGRAMAELIGWSTWSEVEFSREERALEKAAGEMRLLMEKVSRERRAAGDPRRVTEESVMGNIVRPVVWGGEEEAEPQGGDTAVIPRLKEESVAPPILGKMTNTPWAIREGMLDTMVGIANRDGLRAVSDEMVREEPEICQMVVRDGVAVIPVIGPSFRYASWIHDACGATSYDAIARDLNLALEDPAVKAILFEFDSPGGEVTGCNATAAKIRAARGRKPIVAWVEGDACSAAYWLASACDHVVIDECAQLGSIGVVGIFNDTRGMDEKLGIKRYEIVSSQSPGKRPDPATDEGRAAIQVVIDDLASVFVDAVAINRGVSPEDVVARFGGGGCFVGQKAIDAGLADEIGTFDEVLAELAGVDAECLPLRRDP